MLRSGRTCAAAIETLAYRSPEQALDEPPGPASDWCSLDVLLYGP